jgi:hypothetical protein
MKQRLAALTATLGLLAASQALAGAPPPAFLAQLEGELYGKTHVTRIPVGTLVPQGTSARPVYKRVDTEIHPAGAPRYLCTKGNYAEDGSALLSMSVFLNKAVYIDPRQARALPPGKPVLVGKIEVEKDRIELALDTMGVAPYAKIKLVLGEQGLRSATFDSVMSMVAKALEVESYEARRVLLERYAAMGPRLAETRAACESAQGTASARLQAAERHRATLLEAEQVVRDLAASGTALAHTPSAYAEERAAVERTMAGLQEGARAEKLAETERSLADARAEMSSLQQRLRGASLAQREEAVQACDAVAAREAALLAERAQLGKPARTARRSTPPAGRSRCSAPPRDGPSSWPGWSRSTRRSAPA